MVGGINPVWTVHIYKAGFIALDNVISKILHINISYGYSLKLPG